MDANGNRCSEPEEPVFEDIPRLARYLQGELNERESELFVLYPVFMEDEGKTEEGEVKSHHHWGEG